MKNITPLNPSLNGGKSKDDLLACGCDPDNAELSGEGERKVVLNKLNENFFAPLGAPGMGMLISICAQCKEVLGFQVVTPRVRPPGPLIQL